MGLLLLLAMLVQWLISMLGYIIAAAVIYWVAYWLITSVKELAAEGVKSSPIPHKTKQPDIIITSQQEVQDAVEEVGDYIVKTPIEQAKANIAISSQAEDTSNEATDTKPMNTLDYIEDIDCSEDYEFEGVPYWEHSYIYSATPIRSANKYQQAFYKHLKSEFLKGRYVDVDNCNNYVFILMFDLIDDYKKHRDYELIKDQIKELGTAYPITERYIDSSLAEVVTETIFDRSRVYTTKPKQCQWISKGERYDCNGVILTRGNFYIGDQFVYSNKDYQGRDTYKTITSPVIAPNAPINSNASTKGLFSSYADLAQEDRALYLKWLSEDIAVTDMPTELLYLYLYGLEIRMFADDGTTLQDRISILSDIWEMRSQITDFELMSCLCRFIDNSLIKIHPYEPKEIVSEYLMEGSCAYSEFLATNFICNIDGDRLRGEDAYILATILHVEDLNNIPKQFQNTVKERFIELFNRNNKKGVFVQREGYEHSVDYSMMTNCHKIYGRFCPQQANIATASYKDRHLYYYSAAEAANNVMWSINRGFNMYNTSDNKMIGVLSLPDYIDISQEPETVLFKKSIDSLVEGREVALAEFDSVLECVKYIRKEEKTFHKSYLSIIDRAFSRIGYGIVPNYEIDYKRLNFGNNCVIYRRSTNEPLKRGVAHERTAIFARLAAIICKIDTVTDAEREYIKRYISSNCKGYVNREHLYAHFVWLSSGKLGVDAKIKKGIAELLNSEQSSKLCNSLIELCCLGGNPAPKKISALQRILPLFGEDGSDIHSRIHRFYTGEGDNFVTVEKQSGADGFKIPKPNEAKQTFHIDQKKINKLEVQTKESHKILSAIFNNNESESEVSVEQVDTSAKVDPIMELLKLLLTKECWQRSEVESLCRERGLMLGSVLEKINDYSFSKIDEAVVDDDGDEIYVAVENKERLLNM